jgi:hypothetical protein
VALDHALPRALYYSRSPHWHPVTSDWSEVPLAPEERAVGGYDFEDPEVSGMDLWMADEWVRALDEGRDHVINAAVGANTMEMIHGAYRSHAEGRRIELPQESRDHPLAAWLAREGRPEPPPAPADYKDWIVWALDQAARHTREPVLV